MQSTWRIHLRQTFQEIYYEPHAHPFSGKMASETTNASCKSAKCVSRRPTLVPEVLLVQALGWQLPAFPNVKCQRNRLMKPKNILKKHKAFNTLRNRSSRIRPVLGLSGSLTWSVHKNEGTPWIRNTKNYTMAATASVSRDDAFFAASDFVTLWTTLNHVRLETCNFKQGTLTTSETPRQNDSFEWFELFALFVVLSLRCLSLPLSVVVPQGMLDPHKSENVSHLHFNWIMNDFPICLKRFFMFVLHVRKFGSNPWSLLSLAYTAGVPARITHG